MGVSRSAGAMAGFAPAVFVGKYRNSEVPLPPEVTPPTAASAAVAAAVPAVPLPPLMVVAVAVAVAVGGNPDGQGEVAADDGATGFTLPDG